MDFKRKVKDLQRDIPAVFLALKHKDTPIIAKIFAIITVSYALSPIDLIPDFIPVLGAFDDVVLLPLLIGLTVKFIPSAIFEQCRKEAEGMWDNGKPIKWYYTIPILLVWLIIILIVVKSVLGGIQ